jgi:hypothetical protein
MDAERQTKSIQQDGKIDRIESSTQIEKCQ